MKTYREMLLESEQQKELNESVGWDRVEFKLKNYDEDGIILVMEWYHDESEIRFQPEDTDDNIINSTNTDWRDDNTIIGFGSVENTKKVFNELKRIGKNLFGKVTYYDYRDFMKNVIVKKYKGKIIEQN